MNVTLQRREFLQGGLGDLHYDDKVASMNVTLQRRKCLQGGLGDIN